MPEDAFSFDERVAQRYNRQRQHAPDVSQKIGQAIANLTGSGALVLEIGVGTGRIAWPVSLAGCRVTGIDLSSNMLEEVMSGRPPQATTSPALLRADMHHLPFCKDTFAAVLAVHVLHLTKDTPRLLAEAARVLQSGGVFIQGDDWIDPQSVVGALQNQLRRYALDHAPELLPPAALVSREQLLADLGATTTETLTVAEWSIEVSPVQRLAEIQNRLDPESWILPPHLFDGLVPHLRAYALERWGDLDTPQPVTRRFILKVTRGDW